MKLFLYCIGVLFFLGLLSFIFGDNVTTVPITFVKYDSMDRDWDPRTVNFGIDIFDYGISFLVVVGASIAALGVRILGSGLSSSTVRTMTIIVFYVALWIMASTFAWDLMFLNNYVGTAVYTFLCIGAIVGVSQKISGGS